ncbi:hypothetical protein E4T49_05408 [Aureobasidium sp. EXF-10728]|nr:hypothetical protein E4T49_05408 [Aureobasidium sp. EXF-10728]
MLLVYLRKLLQNLTGSDRLGGVIQLDLGKVTTAGFLRTGALNKPPAILLKALASLESKHDLRGPEDVPRYMSEAFHKFPKLRKGARHPGMAMDKLFLSDYSHPNVTNTTCVGCDTSKLVERESRDSTDPCIHYGSIGSGNQVIKDSRFRDSIGKECGILCFEMEAAGIMDNFPCIVIRGICDYSDSHKTKEWQRYAAVASAAYAKELLHTVPPAAVEESHTALNIVQGSQSIS